MDGISIARGHLEMVIITWAALWISSHPAEMAIFSNFPQPPQDQVQQILPTDSQECRALPVLLFHLSIYSHVSVITSGWKLKE